MLARGKARDLLHDSSWHGREEEAERERERRGRFIPTSQSHSLPAFPSLAGGKGGRQAGRQVAAAATAGCRWRQLKGVCAI